jgi:hypothetical protein
MSSAISAGPFRPAGAVTVGSSFLVGRATELERLDEALQMLDERGTALLVVGEPGIGKTALLTEAARRAHDRGMLVLTSFGLLSEAHLPYAGLHQLFRPVLRYAERSQTLPGDTSSAGQTAEEAERFFLPLGGVPILALASLVRSVDHLAQDRNNEAYDQLRPIFDTSRGATWTVASQGAVSFFLDAAVLTGHLAEARSVTE